MPASGRPWESVRGQFREECKAAHARCWLCNEPIDYYAKAKTPKSFSADHVTPTSLGGDALRKANLKPAHYGCNASRGNTTRGQFPTSRPW